METLNLDDYDTPEKVAKLGERDAEFAEIMAARQPPPPDLSDVPALRSFTAQGEKHLADSLPALPASLKQLKVRIPFRDGHVSEAILIHPTPPPDANNSNNAGGYPLVVLFHGGGWTIGTPLQMLPTARGLAQLLGCAVLLPSYRLAPEHPFPTGVLDAWDALLFAAAKSNFAPLSVPIDHGRGFVISGFSSGGNFAAVLAQKAHDEGLTPKLTGQYLGIPALVSGYNVPERYRALWFSPLQNVDAPIHSHRDRLDFERVAGVDPRSPLASPLNASAAAVEKEKEVVDTAAHGKAEDPEEARTFFQFEGESGGDRRKGLPRAVVQTCGLDPVRDDGLVYARLLRDSGVETKVLCYRGVPHGWWIFFPDMKLSRTAFGDIARAFAWLLGVEDWKENQANDLMALPW